MTRLKVLHVEADQDYALRVRETLSGTGDHAFAVANAASLAAARELLGSERFDAALLAPELPDSDDFQAVMGLARSFPETPLIVLAGREDARLIEGAVLSAGAAYLLKSEATPGSLLRTILHEVKRKSDEKAILRVNNALKAHSAVNAAMLSCGTEDEFLKEAARIVAENCGYKVVAVILAAEDGGKKARVAAQSAGGDHGPRVRASGLVSRGIGSGIAGLVMRTARPCVCSDVRVDGRFPEMLDSAVADKLLAGLGVPLLKDGMVVGAITAYSDTPRDCSEAEVSHMEGIAADMAAGLEMLRARKESDAAEKALVRLNGALMAHSACNRLMLSARSENEFLEGVVGAVGENCGYACVTATLAFDDENKTAQVAAQGGALELELRGAVSTWADEGSGRGITGEAIRTGRPCACGDMITDGRFPAGRAMAARYGVRSGLSVPMLKCGRAVGALTGYSAEARDFPQEEIAQIESLAADMVSGMEMFEARRDKAAAEKSLSDAGSDVFRLFDESTVPLVAWGPDLRITGFNRAFEDFTGYSAQEVRGRELSSIFSCSLPDWAEDHGRNMEVQVRLKDGRLRTLLWSSGRLRLAGNSSVVFGQAQDITERKRAEEAVRHSNRDLERLASERAAQLLETRGELERSRHLTDIGMLASTVAHELRNPLAAITMAAYNIGRKAGAPAIETHLRNIEKKVGDANQIINNLLFYSRIKEPQRELADLGQILRECVRSARVAGPRGARPRITLEVPDMLPLEADPVQLKEIFFNIISNAIDAVAQPKGGAITVRAGGSAESAYAEICDTGAGMSPDVVAKACDPFFTTKPRGTGLGLYVCRQLVDLHKGKMEITSSAGGGTTVKVTLPRFL